MKITIKFIDTNTLLMLNSPSTFRFTTLLGN